MTLAPGGAASARSRLFLAGIGHAVLSLALCWDSVLLGRVPYVRDVPFLYVPDFAFLARSLSAGIWPLWHPLIDGGRPFLFGYPPDIALVALLGPIGAAGAECPLHLWIAACGASFLARVRGHQPMSAWAAGSFYACSGYVLSCGSIFPLLQAAAWAPWVIGAALLVLERPSPRRVGALALLAAVQVGSLAAEIVLQTAVAVLVLGGRWREPRRWLAACGAGLLAAAVSAPVMAGARAMAADTARAAGFSDEVTLSWSMHPLALPALVLPRYFGDMHTFSDLGYWGQPFFEDGYPYFLSTYVGVIVGILAALGASRRLVLLALLGILTALGSTGPFPRAIVAVLAAAHVRVPSKFLFLTVLAATLMAAEGLDRASGRRVSPWVLAPGLALTLAAGLLLARPEAFTTLAAAVVPALADPRAIVVMRQGWPLDFLKSGILALLSGAILCARPRMLPLVVLAGLADLFAAGADLNPTAPRSFYSLREPVRELVEKTRGEGLFRWLTYGAVSSPVRWRPEVARSNRDLPLYAIEVQSLMPRIPVLFGLEGVFDEDRTAFAPRGSTLSLEERRPGHFRDLYPRARLGNVRYVVTHEPLADDRVRLRGLAALAETASPLLLYELRDPLPRAYWVPEFEVAAGAAGVARRTAIGDFDPLRTVMLEAPPALPPRAAPPLTYGEPSVTYERIDPHTVRLHANTPPGFIVVLDGYDRAWSVSDAHGAVSLLRANGRYWALPTDGGVRELEARFRPAWRTPALLVAAAGLLVSCGLVVLRTRPVTGIPRQPAGPDPADTRPGGA